MSKIEKAYAITDAKISFVSLVDKAANKKQFLITKAEHGSASFASYGRIVNADADSHYITGLVGPQNVLQAYIPAVPGKEPRKPEPGKEGLLGVEGVDDALILQGLHTALAAAPLQAQQQNTDPITYTDLYEWGLSGSANASERRRTFLRILGLPPRLSKKEIIQVLNTLYTRAALQVQLQAMK